MSTLDARVAALETALADKSAELDTFYLIWASGLVFLMQVRRTTLFSSTRRNCCIYSQGNCIMSPGGRVASLLQVLPCHSLSIPSNPAYFSNKATSHLQTSHSHLA